MFRLFIDDERYPIDDNWVIVRNYYEAISYMENNGCPYYVSFDHDLGYGKTGYDISKWMVNQDIDSDFFPSNFDFFIHSQNPIGKTNIEEYFKSYFLRKFK